MSFKKHLKKKICLKFNKRQKNVPKKGFAAFNI